MGAKNTLNPQDIVVAYCQDEINKHNLLYCVGIDSFFYYHKEEGYFKLMNGLELEKLIFKFMLFQYKKSISSGLVRDVIKMMKYFVYNTCENNLNDYVALTDGKVLNTKTFEIVEATPKIHAFSKVNCSSKDIEEYNKELPPVFKYYLESVLVDRDGKTDNELINVVQEVFGYYLMNTLEAHASFFMVGSGGNGKSVMLDVLKEVVGTTFVSSATIEDLSSDPFATSSLVGKKINICDEDESKFVNSAKFKALVSGNAIHVQRKFQDAFMWVPTTKFIFSTNEMPTFTGFNRGLTRRIYIIPFNKEIPDNEKDTKLTQKIIKEIQFIVPWAIEGAKRLVANGFKFSKSEQIDSESQEFIKNISSTAMFLGEHYEPSEFDFVSGEYLYDLYKMWCGKRGKKEVNYYNFIKETERSLGIRETEGNDGEGTLVKGFKLKTIEPSQQKIEL